MAATEATNSFLTIIKTLMDMRNFDDLKTLFFSENKKEEILDNCWDVVPMLCRALSDHNNRTNPGLVNFSEQAIIYLAKHGNPKELLLAFLEQADCFKDDVKFKVLLSAIQISLLKLPSKRHHSLEVTLETVYAHVLCLELPQELNFEGEEKKLLDCDPKVIRIEDIMDAMLQFLRPFVFEIPAPSECDDSQVTQKQQLSTFLLKLLNHPLVFLDLAAGSKSGSKSHSRAIAENLMKFMGHMWPDIFKAVQWLEVIAEQANTAASEQEHDYDYSQTELNDLDLGMACFAYLVHGEGLLSVQLPVVFTAHYFFEINLSHISVLLQRTQSLAVYKGLTLLYRLITLVTEGTLHFLLLENDHFVNCIRDLSQVMIRCPAKDLRVKAASILPCIITKFDAKGRNAFIYHLLNSSNHYSIVGYVVHLLKEEINKTLCSENPTDELLGVKLSKHLRFIFKLPDNETTDLLDNSDAILSALNFLRFLVLRDNPNANITGIWDHMEKVEKSYLAPLRTGLTLSKGHYELDYKKAKESNYSPKADEMSFSILGGGPLPKLSKEQQLAMFESALNTFSLIESVLVRTEELIKQEKVKIKACNDVSKDIAKIELNPK